MPRVAHAPCAPALTLAREEFVAAASQLGPAERGVLAAAMVSQQEVASVAGRVAGGDAELAELLGPLVEANRDRLAELILETLRRR